MATKQIILELGRINSIGVEANGPDTDNKSNFTCIIPETNFKKNDIVQLDGAIINVRGADSNSIQLSGGQVSTTNKIVDNTFLTEIGFYINSVGQNSVGLPFCFPGQISGLFRPQEFDNTTTTGAGDDELLNYNYNSANNRSYLSEAGQPSSNDYTARLPYVPITTTGDAPTPEYFGVETCNPFNRLNGKKYAMISKDWNGWMRSYDTRLGTTEPKLMTEDVPIKVPTGFTSPNAIADLITLTFQKTNPLKFDGKVLEDYKSPSANYYKEDADESPKVLINQPVLNGYCYKSIDANWSLSGDEEYRNTAHRIYSLMATENPYYWKYGTGILSMTETYDMNSYAFLNPNTFDSPIAQENIRLAYPCIVWNTFVGNSEITPNLQQYSIYSPTEEQVITGHDYDENVLVLTGLTGSFDIFNDNYRGVYSGNYGAYIFRQGNKWAIVGNQNLQVIDDQGQELKPQLYVDDTDPNHTNLIGWNRYAVLGGRWAKTIEQLARTVQQADFFTTYLSDPADALTGGFFYDTTYYPGEDYEFNAWYNIGATGGVSGNKYLYNLLTTPDIVEGERYTLSFTTTFREGGGGSSNAYAHPIIVADRTSAFGMAGATITADGNYTQTFTATASYSGNNSVMVGFQHGLPYGQVVKVSNFSFTREDPETDENYNVLDVNAVDLNGTISTTFEDNKIYGLSQVQSIGTYELNLSNNTIPSQGTYIGVDYNRNYKVLVRGLICSFTSGNFVCTNLLNGHPNDVCILYNNEDPNYTYFIFQGYSFTDRWTIYRLSKYNGGIPINGTVLGSIQSVGFNLKLGFRNGQQYYDFSQANHWDGTFKPILKDIPNPFDNTSTFTFDPTSCYVHYSYVADDAFDFTYIATEPQNWAYVQSILTEPITANEEITVSFTITNLTNPGNPINLFRIITSYIEGGVNYKPRDFTAEGDHSFTFTTTQAPLNPALAIYWGFYNTHSLQGDQVRISNFTIRRSDQVNMTSHIAQTLPSITYGANIYEYFTSFQAHDNDGDYHTYYLGANNNGNGDDTDKEGGRGRLIWSEDGGTTYQTGTWDWNGGAFIDLSIGLTLTYTGSAPQLTDIVTYSVYKNVPDSGFTYSVPSDGRMYGSGYGAFGTTDFQQTTPGTLYLGAGLTQNAFTNGTTIKEGYVYNNINDPWANNNGFRWKYNAGTLQIINNTTGKLIDQFQKTGRIIEFGWVVARSDKLTDYDTYETFDNIQDNIGSKRISGTPNEIPGLVLNSLLSGPYDFGPLDNSAIQTLNIQNLTDAYLDRTRARIPKSTILMTNIKFNMNNIKRIENFFRYCEVYSGSNEIRNDIINDIENYSVELDLNWTDDNTTSTNSRDISHNTTGNKGVVLPYYYHSGQMGEDDSNEGGSERNEGVIFPRKKGDNDTEQRIKIFTRYKSDPYERCIYTNRAGYDYNFVNDFTEKDFQTKLPTEYDYITSNNIGVIPFPLKDQPGTYVICFEVFQDYINKELWSQQSLQFIGYSPSLLDHNYIIPLNADEPSIKNTFDDDGNQTGDFNFTGVQEDQMNFINVGAVNPTFQYNDQLSKFEISNFHTPLQFNKNTGSDAQIQNPYFIVRGQQTIFRDYMKDNETEVSYNVIDDIADAQSGIYVNNIFFQTSKDKLITSSSDGSIIEANNLNFYGSLLWRMGFSYYQFRPLNFFKNMFSNRFQNLFYNSLLPDYRKYAVRPFTTNALVNIASANSLNVFTQNSGNEAVENPNKATPSYNLGYCNNIPVSSLATSDKMTAKSLIVPMKSAFYRIICPDLPLDTLSYNAQGSKYNAVGTALLNYSSANMFFYSYASSYNATITRDTTINSLSVQIVDDVGNLVEGLDDRSCITLKIIRNIELEEPPPDPIVSELKDIEKDIEDLTDKTEITNTELGLERASQTEGVGVLNEETASNLTDEGRRFLNSLILSIVRTGLNRATITQQAKPRQFKDLSNIFGRSVAQYYLSNVDFINYMKDGLEKEGIKFLRNNKRFNNFLREQQDFILKPNGEIMIDPKQQGATYSINEDGAEILLNEIEERLNEGGSVSSKDLVKPLSSKILDLLKTGGTITPPQQRSILKPGSGLRLRSSGYNQAQKTALKKLLGDRYTDFIKKLGISSKGIDTKILKKLYQQAVITLQAGRDRDFRSIMGDLLEKIKNKGVQRVKNVDFMTDLLGVGALSTGTGKPLFKSLGETIEIPEASSAPLPQQPKQEKPDDSGGGGGGASKEDEPIETKED